MRRVLTGMILVVVAMLVTPCNSAATTTPDIPPSGVQVLTGRADAVEDGGTISTEDWNYGLPINDVQ
jgi:predicted small secreted protein